MNHKFLEAFPFSTVKYRLCHSLNSDLEAYLLPSIIKFPVKSSSVVLTKCPPKVVSLLPYIVILA